MDAIPTTSAMDGGSVPPPFVPVTAGAAGTVGGLASSTSTTCVTGGPVGSVDHAC